MSGIIPYKDVCVVDNCITDGEHTRILKLLTGSVWRYGWPYPYSPLDRPCWHSFIAGSGRGELDDCEQELRNRSDWGFLADIWIRIKAVHMPTAILLGVYANGQTSSQDGPIHRDNTADAPGRTVMLFCSEYWASCWGGELMFYDAEKENIVMAVQPKPKRIVVFNGEVPHGARAPAVSCNRLRMSIAFKTLIRE